MSDFLEQEGQRILESLASMPFETCYPLSRRFEVVPTNPALYAVRYRPEGILYLGKAINLRRRFKDGHKALSWAFVDRLDPDDVRIAAEFLPPSTAQYSTQIEILMIRIAQPRYNSLIK